MQASTSSALYFSVCFWYRDGRIVGCASGGVDARPGAVYLGRLRASALSAPVDALRPLAAAAAVPAPRALFHHRAALLQGDAGGRFHQPGSFRYLLGRQAARGVISTALIK